MLILSRKQDEQIIIGDDITVMVVEIRGDKVRLGIQAPEDVPVHRQEIYEAIQQEGSKHDSSTQATTDSGTDAANGGVECPPAFRPQPE